MPESETTRRGGWAGTAYTRIGPECRPARAVRGCWQGCIREEGGGGGGRLKGGRGGLAGDPPSSQGPPMAPAEGGPNILKLQSSWHRRRRSKTLAVSLKHWKRTRGGGVMGGGTPPPLLLRCPGVPIHHRLLGVLPPTLRPLLRHRPRAQSNACDGGARVSGGAPCGGGGWGVRARDRTSRVPQALLCTPHEPRAGDPTNHRHRYPDQGPGGGGGKPMFPFFMHLRAPHRLLHVSAPHSWGRGEGGSSKRATELQKSTTGKSARRTQEPPEKGRLLQCALLLGHTARSTDIPQCSSCSCGASPTASLHSRLPSNRFTTAHTATAAAPQPPVTAARTSNRRDWPRGQPKSSQGGPIQ